MSLLMINQSKRIPMTIPKSLGPNIYLLIFSIRLNVLIKFSRR